MMGELVQVYCRVLDAKATWYRRCRFIRTVLHSDSINNQQVEDCPGEPLWQEFAARHLVDATRIIFAVNVRPPRHGHCLLGVRDAKDTHSPISSLSQTITLSPRDHAVPSIAALAGLSAAWNAYAGGLPIATGTVSSSAVIEVAAGETFDSGWKRVVIFTATFLVFYLHEGVTPQNVIVEANQEGRFLSILRLVLSHLLLRLYRLKTMKLATTRTYIMGGGAYHTEDKDMVEIPLTSSTSLLVLYQSCGTCKRQCSRNVHISGVCAKDGETLAGINSDYGVHPSALHFSPHVYLSSLPNNVLLLSSIRAISSS
ncbi:hypothetical protein IW262DRAFT_1293778 [Armillaria fumosa]|nr:hypothetical protein IW262DRAFT_1293778 [Armillaria fumosa]